MEKYKKFEFVLLIPVFHNEDKIEQLKLEIQKYLVNESYFICFVDDSSNEETHIQIKKSFDSNFFVLRRKKVENFSTRYSASLDGFKWILDNLNTEFIVEIDSDLSHHPKDILKGINLLKNEKCDLVIGSKYRKNSIVKNRKFIRILISKFITLTCRIIFDRKITDYSNTFRFYNKSLAVKFTQREMLFKSPIGHLHNLLFIINNNYSIKEISTEYVETNPESTVKIKYMLKYLIEFIYCILINKFSNKIKSK